jgi:hypothetical protein
MVNVDRCLKLKDIPQEVIKISKEKTKALARRPKWPENGNI